MASSVKSNMAAQVRWLLNCCFRVRFGGQSISKIIIVYAPICSVSRTVVVPDLNMGFVIEKLTKKIRCSRR